MKKQKNLGCTLNGEYFMNLALKQAKKASAKGEIPIGAVVVCNNKVVAKAFNQRERTKDATAHAEMLAIKKACKKLKSWRLGGCDIYVTLLPCPMCLGAILNARIDNLYFGATENKNGEEQLAKTIISQGVLNHRVNMQGGLCELQCSSVLKEFFKHRRAQNKQCSIENN